MFKRFLSLALVVFMVASMMPVSAFAAENTNVAKIGDTEYATLQAAMTEANKAAGDYTITLLDNSAEVFTFAQKSGVNITIDGDGNTFSGKITLKAGGGNLTFTDAKIAPANSQTIYLADSTAPNVTFDGCTLQGINKSGTIVHGDNSYTTTTTTIKSCTADNLAYLVSMRQGGHNIWVEDVTATNMLYLLRPLKTKTVTVKNVTCSAVIAIQVRAEAADCKMTIENLNVECIEYSGSYYSPIQTHNGSNSVAYTVEIKGVNTFETHGAKWFSGTAGFTNNAEASNGTKIGTLAAIADDAKSGDTIKLLKETDATVELPYGITLDKNGFEAPNVTVEEPEFTVMIGETGYKTLADAIADAEAGDTITFVADIKENVTISKKVTIDGDGKTYTGKMTIAENTTDTVKFVDVKFLADTTVGNSVIVEMKGNTKASFVGCDFTSNSTDTYYNSYKGITIANNCTVEIKNSTASKLYYLAHIAQGSKSMTVENCTLTDMVYGVGAFKCTTVNVKNFTYAGMAAGINVKNSASTLALENVNITTTMNGQNPVAMWAPDSGVAAVKYTITLKGENVANGAAMTKANEADWFVRQNESNPYEIVDLNGLAGSGTQADPYKISSVEDLIKFRDSVNAGETKYSAPGVYVALTANIDLAGTDWSVNIGDDCNATFDGIFDGKGYTISNLTSTETAQKADGYICTGLFGAIAGNAVIKNLTIENVSINTGDFTGNNVAAVVGFAYKATGSIENVTVKGNIQINAAKADGVGAIVGYVYGGKLTIKNCVVNGTATTRTGSAVVGQAYVGGVVGYADKATLSNNTVQNIAVNATSAIAGGVAGIMLGGGVASGNTVKNVTLTSAHENWQNAVGVVTGSFTGTVTVSGTAAEGNSTTAIVGVLHANKPSAPLAKAEAAVGDVYYATFAAAYAAAKAGETITLLTDLTATEIIVIDKAITLDGAGHKLTSSAARAINVATEGNVAIKNLTIKASGERAINVITKPATLTIDNVTATAANYTVNVAGSAGAAKVTVTKSDLTGLNVVNVAGEGAEVTVANTKLTTNDNSTAEGYSMLCLNKDAKGGKITATNVEFVIAGTAGDDTVKATNQAEEGTITINGSADEVDVDVAYISYGTNWYGFKTIEAAIAKAQPGETVTLLRDITASEIITIDKAITLDGNGKTLTSSAARAINVETEGKVVISNLTINAGERAVNIINKAATVELNKVIATANNNAVMIATSAGAVKLTINDSDLTGLAVVNVAGAGAQVAINNTKITNTDATAAENYGAITVWTSAENAEVTVSGGQIIVADDSKPAYVFPANATVTGVENVGYIVAIIGDAGFDTLAEAFEKAENGDTIKMVRDAAVTDMIVNTKKVTLDLNGKTITGTDNTTKNFSLIDNRGELTITGNGTMTVTATVNSGWNRYSAVIANNPGGKLVVENGTIEHLGGTDMAYGIDNLTNGKGTYAETVIKGGTIKSTYRAIRQFLNGIEAQNILTINGGTIEGANKSIFFHDPSTKANTGKLTVSENAVLNGNVYLFVTAGSTEWPVEVSIATAALNGEIVTGNVPEKYIVEEANGIWGVREANYVAEVNGTKYESLATAISEAAAGDTITLIGDVNESVTIDRALTIDGAEFNYTGTMTVNNVTVTIENVNFVKGQVYKNKSTGSNAKITIKKCVFDGQGLNAYAINLGGTNAITIENVTAKDYGYGLLQVPSSCAGLTVKNVTVSGCYYGLKVDYANSVTIENANIDATIGIYDSNFGTKTYTITDSTISSISIWERSAAKTTTFKFEGENTVGTLSDSAYAKYAMAPEAKLTTTEVPGLEISTDEGYEVVYKEGTYYIAQQAPVAKIGNVKYATLAEAVAAATSGQTITLLRDAKGAGVVIDKDLKINFNYKTYTLTEPVGSKGTESNGFQLLKGNTVTLMNGTLKVAEEAAGKFYILIQNYSNLTVNGMTLDGTNLDKWSKTDGDSYVLSNNSGKVTINSKTVITKNNDGDKAWALDVCDKSAWGYDLPTVTVGSNVPAADIEAAAKISNTYYATLQQAVDQGGTVNLYRDVEGAGVVISKNVNINFAGKTYTLTEPVGSKGTESNGFQILKGTTVVLRNGTLKVADKAADKFYILVQNYADKLTVSGMTLDGTNLDKYAFTDGDSYTLSNNNGAVTVNGKTQIIANNDGDLAFALDACDKTAWGYKLPTVTVDATCTIEGEVEAAAKVGNVYYATFAAAYEKATGKTISLYKDMYLTEKDVVKTEDGLNVLLNLDKSMTLDLNGHTIYVDYDSDELLYAVVYVPGTIYVEVTDSVGNGGIELKTGKTKTTNGNYDCVAYMFWKRSEKGQLHISGGNYHANMVEDSLVYTNGAFNVVVSGGKFILDNVGTGANGSPWIFNAQGRNERKVIVTGGTFNADVFHQYWVFEVQSEKEYALQKNADGTWTVVDAVCYVPETYGKYTKNVGYASIMDALNAPVENVEIILLGDIVLP